MGEEAVAVFALDGNLLDGRIVDADAHTLHAVVLVSHLLPAGGVGVVVLVAAEDIELLLVAQAADLREYVVASLEPHGVGVAGDG